MNEQRKREDLQTKWDDLWVEVQRIREDAQKRIAEARESAARAWQTALDSMAKAAGRVVDAQQQLARAIERQTDTLKDAATALRKALEDIKTARSESAAGTAGAVPQMAGGGYIPPGGAAIVGEQGPELFVPSQSGTIVPGAMIAAGADAPSITINVQGGIYGDQRLVELIKSTVLDALRQAKYAT
jgi:vacuolar-type H+-ATPase subunit H